MEIDLAKLQAEISSLSPEEVAKQLLDLRTKQRVQQKKYGNDEKRKEYQKKKAEFNKLLAAKAKEMGIYDKILDQAKEAADAKLAAEEADNEDAQEAA